MRDKSKQLLVINTGKKKSEQTGMPSQSGTTHIIGGGGLSVNMSDYLLKSIWDKVFEIRTDSQGTEYLFGKLPVVTQYGITMYSGDGVDIPSLASGLPFDGRTIWYNPDTQQIEVIGGTGGGSGEGVSNFWDLSGIPSWITSSKPKYTYSEIEGTPDLSGYATESWVLGKSYITSATLGTELAKYVTLDTDQPLKGKKDFKNGLSIDGLELRKSQDDVIYIDANLVVRGGVTMYAQNEVDIPSIIDAIPTASTTVKGIASFDGNYFSVDANGKVSLIASNVGLNEEELYNYLTSNNYAKKTDIPSLVGYATQSWVNTRIDSLINGAPAAYDTLKEIADVLQGNVNSIGDIITALGTKWTQDNTKIANWDTAYSWGNHANVGYALKSYVDSTFVTLGSTQTITGEKNFVGGLKVNGSPIYYDTEKKYWKLEGDLLVTGGVTMYGSDSSFVPSTIMDAINVDGTTISKEGGVLKVIGGTGGGVADSVAWANITGKPTFATVATSGKYSDLSGTPSSLPASDVYSWAKSATKPTYTWSEITSKPTWIGSSKPSYSYSEITGAISTTELQNYLTQNSYLNVTSGDNRYLKLSGGTLTSSSVPLYLDRTDSNSYTLIGYRNTSKDLGYLGFSNYGDLVVSPNRQNGNTNYYVIWHEENFNPSNYLHLSSGGTITGNVTLKAALYGESYISWKDPETTEGGYFYGTTFNASKNYTWTSSLLNWNVDTGVINFRKTPTVNGDSVWHSGNDGHNSGLDADTLDGYHCTILMSYVKGSGYVQANLLNSELWNIAGGDGYIEYYDNGTWFNSRWGKVTAHYGFEGSLSGNASSATKLQNSRTIWGRAFDGTSDITGSLYITNNNAIYIKDTSDNWLNQIEVSSGNAFNIGYSSGGRGYSTLLYGGDITLKVGISRVTSLYIDSNRNGEYNGMFTFKRASQVPLYISNTDSSLTDVCARFVVNNAYKASIGTNSGDYLLRYNADLSKSYVIWDSGNDGHDSGLDADTLDGYHSNAFMNFTSNSGYVGASMGNETLSKLAGGNGYIEFWDGAGGWFNFRLGNILAAGGITMYSMRKLKNVVDERGLSLSELSTIKPTRYTWKDGRDNRLHFGGIADDIQQVLPEVVYSTSDGILTMDYGNAAFAVASSLIQPVVDHEKRIAMLEEENKELRNEVGRLKAS